VNDSRVLFFVLCPGTHEYVTDLDHRLDIERFIRGHHNMSRVRDVYLSGSIGLVDSPSDETRLIYPASKVI